jgi:hypothetical protein
VAADCRPPGPNDTASLRLLAAGDAASRGSKSFDWLGDNKSVLSSIVDVIHLRATAPALQASRECMLLPALPPRLRYQPLAAASRSAKYLWTNWMAMEPAPTADATRVTDPWRTSPTANTPGTLVSMG